MLSLYEILSKEILTSLGCKTLKRWKFEQMTTLMYKTFNCQAPSLEEHFEIKNNERYYLRNNEKMIKLPKSTTNSMTESLTYYDARVWNNLLLYF